MRTILFFLLHFCVVHYVTAQSTVMVLHVAGQVQYLPHYGAKPVNLAPGDELDIKGKIRCKGNGSARLVYEGTPITVTGTKMRDVEEIVKTAAKSSEMSFTGRFFNFLNESLKEGVTDEKLKKHHRRYMNKTSGGIKGFATPEATIKALLTTTGKLPQANVIFKWRKVPGSGPYLFVVQDARQKTVAQLLLRDTLVVLDLDHLALNLDEEYTWSVTRGEKDRSAQIPFEICPATSLDQQTDLSHEKTYQSASETEKQLMLAYRLEEERFFYAAQKTYQDLLQHHPDNAVFRRMYATFLARLDMLPEAETLISGKQK
ncbi:MAG TPA: hypothetical protein VK168_10430 [Saprospiraceae bacterium]|nr:hypothetical protein [Saprospiraceae bacterium]